MLLTGWCALAIGAWAECRHRGGAPALVAPVAGCSGRWPGGPRPRPRSSPGGADGGRLADRRPRRAAGVAARLLVARDHPARFALVSLHAAPLPGTTRFFFGRELAGRMAGKVDGRHGSHLLLRAGEPRGMAAVVAAGGVGGSTGNARLIAGARDAGLACMGSESVASRAGSCRRAGSFFRWRAPSCRPIR